MSYTPKSDEQLAREGLLPDAIYDYEVVDTSDKPSKKGSDMYTLKLHVFSGIGDGAHTIYDYIALGNNFGERKLRHAADASNLLAIYETGKLKPSDFMGTTGKVQIKTQDGNADYPIPKNAVADYVKRAPKETVATGALPEDVLNDDVPF